MRRTAVKMSRKSMHEEEMWLWLEREQPGEWMREHRFHPTRRWRFDFAKVHEKLAIEIDGIVWGGRGGHQTGVGMTRDRIKDAEAMVLGWRILRITPLMMRDGSAYEYIRKLT